MSQNKTYHLSLKEFESVFNRLYTPLCLFSYKYVNNLEEAEDIVQNVFTKVLAKKTLIEDKNKIDGFFYTAVRNKSLDFIKSKYAKDFKTYSTGDLNTLNIEDSSIKETIILDVSAIVQNAINTLPEKAAQVIKLSIQDYSNQEIANELKITPNTVKAHKQKIYKKFRLLLNNLKDKS